MGAYWRCILCGRFVGKKGHKCPDEYKRLELRPSMEIFKVAYGKSNN